MRDLWRSTKNGISFRLEKYWRSYVFVHINKTAGSSIEKALGLRFGHETASEKMEAMGQERWEEKFSFAFVRNPWDRAVSHYHYRVRSNKTGLADGHLDFRSWVREVYENRNPAYRDNEKMFMPQRRWLTDGSGNIVVSFVGRYESLETDYEYVRKKIGRGGALPKVKSSARTAYPDYYDAESAERVARAFEEDIQEFGYSFDG